MMWLPIQTVIQYILLNLKLNLILLFSQCRRLSGNQLEKLSREIFLELSALEEL